MAYKPNSDRHLFIIVNVLALFGLLMVYSASSVAASERHGGMSGYFFRGQVLYAALGYTLMIVLMNVDYHVWQRRRLLRILLILCAAALLFVFTQPELNGAHRWLRYRNISFQPSEIAKLVLMIFIADYLHKFASEINDFRNKLVPCLAVILPFAGLIALEPDFGQAMCLVLIVALLLFIAGLQWKYVFTAAAIALPSTAMAILLYAYRFKRFMAFLNPSDSPLGDSYQIWQSLTAVGSGGLFGLGLGAGRQKLFYLPEAHSDFIFAIIGEELGLIGAVLVCLAFLFFFYRGIKIALKAPDRFGFYLGLGITFMVVIQAFINISMVLALMPTKGIALPFISQGGSSLLMNLMATGILLNISTQVEKG
jgi:cell division protein FtsW